ncbi:chemotaxis-specific protein-glutamate methyltransferase CheB [Sphingomonas lenta]|uniref:protein-glutamate methylesterase n=1 Tax=Sphingomonas lenta TaxID=1141887 RepID=A0A2A2SKU2_9SPHN|nr:chemotaxis-specific protein-glutamate methyltransferase CheB [Sphingomonas lenta]PAX09631.1 chemotaxis response regulator protein-glutamate methylesterase [Sphingomonas lenta]
MRTNAASKAEPRPGRVLIVDDSAVARAVLARVLAGSDRLEVAGSVPTAAAALSFLAGASVDLVILDIQMPGIDGLTALPDLIAAGRGAKVLVVSSAAGEGAAATIQALALGAADTLVKPLPGERAHRFEAGLIEKIERLLLPDAPVARAPVAVRPVPDASVAPVVDDAFDIVAIGASTGGIHALSQLLRGLPPTFSVPILVTQHLPASFMPYFAAQLAVLAGRPCEVATDRMRIRPGRIVIAPGDAHMRCVPLADGTAAVRLSTEPQASGCTPSVDPMFDSVAECFGARALAVVLSGMGRDGTAGARRVAATGGYVVVQDRASSAVWGMPGSVASAGLAAATLDPQGIGRVIASRRRPQC